MKALLRKKRRQIFRPVIESVNFIYPVPIRSRETGTSSRVCVVLRKLGQVAEKFQGLKSSVAWIWVPLEHKLLPAHAVLNCWWTHVQNQRSQHAYGHFASKCRRALENGAKTVELTMRLWPGLRSSAIFFNAFRALIATVEN